MPAYQDYIARAQVSEAFTLADGLKTNISINRQNGSCFADSTKNSAQTEDKLTGKYGTAEIVQEGVGTADKLVCGIHYKFNKTGVSDKLIGKTITLKADEDAGKLILTTVNSKGTNVENKYLPSAFKKETANSAQSQQ